MNLSALRAFMTKEMRHILRDRQTLTILLLMPLVQVILFGFALRSDVRDVRLIVVDPAPDAMTLALRSRFEAASRFHVVAVARSAREIEPAFRRGEADIALVIEPGFASRIVAPSAARGPYVTLGEVQVPQSLADARFIGTTSSLVVAPSGARGPYLSDPAHLQLIADASDPNTATSMTAMARAVIGQFESEINGPPSGVRIEPRVRMQFNPTLESVNLFVPGLIALVLTLVSALMTAISLSREKERGTLEVLLVSPLRPWEIIIGKVLPYLALAFANVVTALLAAWLVFHVPFRGSVPLLLAESILYAIVSLALGVLIASKTPSQRGAMLGAMVGTMLPSTLLSGMIFPIASMPSWLSPFTNIVPARWFIVVARGIMLKGVGIEHLWRETLVLGVMALVLVVASVRSFKPRLA